MGAGKFPFANIFRESKNIFRDFSVGMEQENEKTESVNENKNKENRSVHEFQEYILQQKPANTKVKAQSRHEGVECHIINLLLTKLVRSRWLDTGQVLFLRVHKPRRSGGP